MNKLEIEIPDEKEIDWEESKKQNKIILKNKQLTYEDICDKLLKNNFYFIDYNGEILDATCDYTSNCAKTEHQLECILAKNKLANVAKYLNDGWKPSDRETVWYITMYLHSKPIPHREFFATSFCFNTVIFKSDELAQQAIEVLGEETIKLALEPLGI